jgi:uncharacterized membrane protein YphA (DoxX/SURF4 family)
VAVFRALSGGQAPRWTLVIPRVYVGVIFVAAGVGQLAGSSEWTKPGQGWPAALHAQIAEWAPHSAAWYRPLEVHAFLPHAGLLAAVLAWVHLGLGVALIAGIWTRLVAAIAIVLLANYTAAQGYVLYGAGDAPAYLALLVAVWLGRAGRTWGLDALLARRWPRMAIG